MSAEILSFETGRPAELSDDEPSLVVDVEGYEGPLDLLLALARQQKVDLAKISILALADQYLVFIEAARKIRLELAADYLVMAAWLAFLKSRLLLPEPPTRGRTERRGNGDRAGQPAAPARGHSRSGEPADEPAAIAARYLSARQSGIDRRNPASQIHRDPVRPAHRLCRAAPAARAGDACIWRSARCGRWRKRAPRWSAWSASAEDWSCLDEYLLSYVVDPSQKATVFASSFAAALELVREGEMELHQKEAFAPLYFRKRPPQPVSDAMTAPDLTAE